MFLNVLFRECEMSHWTPMSWCLYAMWKHRMQLCVWGSPLRREIPTSLLRNTFLLTAGLPDFRPSPWALTVEKWFLLGAERTWAAPLRAGPCPPCCCGPCCLGTCSRTVTFPPVLSHLTRSFLCSMPAESSEKSKQTNKIPKHSNN